MRWAAARDRRMKFFSPQREFHAVTEAWVTAPKRVVAMKRLASLSSPFHAKIPFLADVSPN